MSCRAAAASEGENNVRHWRRRVTRLPGPKSLLRLKGNADRAECYPHCRVTGSNFLRLCLAEYLEETWLEGLTCGEHVRLWNKRLSCLHTANHRTNLLPKVIMTSRDTCTDTCPFLSVQRGKVVKVNFQPSSQLQQIIYLCLLDVLAITAPPLAVKLARVSHPAACRDVAVGGVNVVTPQQVSLEISPEIFFCNFFSAESLCCWWQECLIHHSQIVSTVLFCTFGDSNCEWRQERQSPTIWMCWHPCWDLSAVSRSCWGLPQGPINNRLNQYLSPDSGPQEKRRAPGFWPVGKNRLLNVCVCIRIVTFVRCRKNWCRSYQNRHQAN